jgi:ATP-dependent exoDNAse (exonuclease V) beta subunit
LELTGIRRLNSATEAAEATVQAIEGSFDSENIESAMDSYSFRENLLQRLIGNLLHLDLMRSAQGQSDSLENMTISWKQELLLSGLDKGSREEALQRLETAYKNAISSDIGKWILNPEHSESACELEIEQLLEDGSLVRSIVDRTFVESTDKGEVRWIIDYKSAVPSENQSDQEFLSIQQDKYSAQMARYRSLFDEEKQVKTLLYFPAANLHQEITV